MLILLAGSYDYAFGLCKMDFILLHIEFSLFLLASFYSFNEHPSRYYLAIYEKLAGGGVRFTSNVFQYLYGIFYVKKPTIKSVIVCYINQLICKTLP